METKPTIVIFGANGMLGMACRKYFESVSYDVIGYTRADFDVVKSSASDLESLVKGWPRKTVVINAIGMIPQKAGELTEPARSAAYVKANSIFPHVLNELCRAQLKQFIHITTDCVYNGNLEVGKAYDEGTPATETNMYGVTKACGEPESAMIIRTSIIGEERKGMKGNPSLLEWVRSQSGQIRGYTNHYWNGVTCLQLAKTIDHCLRYSIRWSGVRHIVSSQAVTKYELVQMIAKAYDVKVVVEPFECSECVNKVLASSQDPLVKSLIIPPLAVQITETAQNEEKKEGE